MCKQFSKDAFLRNPCIVSQKFHTPCFISKLFNLVQVLITSRRHVMAGRFEKMHVRRRLVWPRGVWNDGCGHRIMDHVL